VGEGASCVRSVHSYLGNLATWIGRRAGPINCKLGYSGGVRRWTVSIPGQCLVVRGVWSVRLPAVGGCICVVARSAVTSAAAIPRLSSTPVSTRRRQGTRSSRASSRERRGSGTIGPRATTTAPGSPTLSTGHSTKRFQGRGSACRGTGDVWCDESESPAVVAGVDKAGTAAPGSRRRRTTAIRRRSGHRRRGAGLRGCRRRRRSRGRSPRQRSPRAAQGGRAAWRRRAGRERRRIRTFLPCGSGPG
jgi:hypothetical protein